MIYNLGYSGFSLSRSGIGRSSQQANGSLNCSFYCKHICTCRVLNRWCRRRTNGFFVHVCFYSLLGTMSDLNRLDLHLNQFLYSTKPAHKYIRSKYTRHRIHNCDYFHYHSLSNLEKHCIRRQYMLLLVCSCKGHQQDHHHVGNPFLCQDLLDRTDIHGPVSWRLCRGVQKFFTFK